MLSPRAEQLMNEYFNLPFPGVSGVRCPYYINRRGARAQLRVLTGKGSPQEIVEEAKIISIQYHLGLFDDNGERPGSELIRKFLVEQNLGIECSGFVSHILKEHYEETLGVNITRKLAICPPDKLLRRLICRLRPIENMDVRVYADDRNSLPVNIGNGYQTVKPGDYLIMLETGPQQKRNHIILITGNENNTLHYAHSRMWASEGRYGHGVAKGKIIIQNNGPLLGQVWEENNKTGNENETCLEAKNARRLEIRRLKI